MRVISGSARGKHLSSLAGQETRPTTDRVKESMFNLLMPYVYASAVLDLFAGSGALGIEALSRGAEGCTFVEKNPEAVRIIRKNLADARLGDKASVREEDALTFLGRTQEKYHLILMDPPYAGGFYEPALWKIAERHLLAPGGIIAIERQAGEEIPMPPSFEVLKDRKYGKTAVYIVGRKDETI